MDRRNFLKASGAACATLAGVQGAQARQSPTEPEEFVGVLCDTTRCIGCRSCEVACAQAHGLPVPDIGSDGALESTRDTGPEQLTVVNRYSTDIGDVYVKKQCMHCWQPACTAACLTNAMRKTESGPVTWDGDKCMGCRFCMVSCPFDMPKFEYNEWNPKIQKCDLCWDRLQQGQRPACVASCPNDALMFGTKRELMEIARVRIYNHPDRYQHRIYGEHEAGGTGWLYLSAAPFDQLGLPENVGTTPYPEYTRDFLFAVPIVFFGMPALLYGLSLLVERDEETVLLPEHASSGDAENHRTEA